MNIVRQQTRPSRCISIPAHPDYHDMDMDIAAPIPVTVEALAQTLAELGCDPRALERGRRGAAESGQRFGVVLLQLGLVTEASSRRPRQPCLPAIGRTRRISGGAAGVRGRRLSALPA
jgi:hypothetical protein